MFLSSMEYKVERSEDKCNIKLMLNDFPLSSLNCSMKLNKKDLRIHMPRQLFAAYNVTENKVVSLWELALRKLYKMR